MSKDSDPSKWVMEPHTHVKHVILDRYLKGWFPILSSFAGRIVFLDGFAGRGRYTGGEVGSPIIALRALLDHAYFDRMRHREFVFLFIEANRENAESLQAVIDEFKAERAPWPSNVKVDVINAAFEDHVTEMVKYLQEQKKKLAPTFAFVDPFGYSGLPMALLADLLSYPQAEVFVNFMVGHVQRFVGRDGQQNAIEGLFALPRDEVVANLDGTDDRVAQLRSLYKQQLHNVAGFEHVSAFEMKVMNGNVGYYLLHGTKHRMGVKVMKEAMWNIDPTGQYTFSDRLAGSEVLFTPEPNLKPLVEALLRDHAGRVAVPVEDLRWYSLLQTPYRETHLTPVLKQLEAENQISVRRLGKWGYPKDKTWISFPG
ncbi:three-Cys-motif partner protein TcmP [Kineococcus sp. GCM10028916]|uniref:three-Cys-motif partner protein TcmP n=1 Tax=Kineococcus sp. GCM10028916 TaxID=3273394 RepID=UPI003629E44B